MTFYNIYYDPETKQIEYVFINCDTNSEKIRSFNRMRVTDPTYDISRDHRLVIDPDGMVTRTTPSDNPVQVTKPDHKVEYAKATTAEARITFIAKHLNLTD